MNELRILSENAQNIIIAGHIRPDGDCTGACVATYRYLKNIYPQKNITAYMEVLPKTFDFMDPDASIISNKLPEYKPDMFIALDSSSPDRLGEAQKLFYEAPLTLIVDHHVSNAGYAAQNFIEPHASSTCEVLYKLMADDDIDLPTAAALYTGIVFDSGGFRFGSTSKKTMEIAGTLMEMGIDYPKIMDECFLMRTYTQAQLLGRTLLASMRLMDGMCMVSVITKRMMEFYGAQTEDIEGIIDQMRITRGVEVALLLHETGEQEYKVSMRSNSFIDVSSIAVYFGGGGHVMAAGFTMRGSVHDVINNITERIQMQVDNQ